MLIIISPAKSLDLSQPPTQNHSQPDFLRESRKLIKQLKALSSSEISDLMNVSEKIADENVQRFSQWKTPFNLDNAKQALFMFKGDVYRGMEVEQLKPKDLQFAQDRLRILSGLYGVLRPLDLIQAYRLEMGTELKNERGANLYEFWGDRPGKAIKQALSDQKDNVLINLASNEYSSVLDFKQIGCDVITPVFKETKAGKHRVLSFFAKRARGVMAGWIIRKRVKSPNKLKDFNSDGYRFNDELSSDWQWVFTRPQPPKAT